MVLTLGWLSGQTQAWLLYLGLTFVGVVVFLPGGLAQAVAGLRRGLFSRTLHPVPAAALTVAACGVLLGLSALIEMAYHRHQQASLGARVRFLGLWLDSASAGAWLMAVALALAGALLCRAAWTRLAPPARQARPGPRDASRPGAQHEPKP
jgi:branched-chain amino acid transport system permease protein